MAVSISEAPAPSATCARCDELTAMAEEAWNAGHGPDGSALSDVVALRQEHLDECLPELAQ
jgi:hypothetical protein